MARNSVRVGPYLLTDTDIVRICVIASLYFTITLATIVALGTSFVLVTTQLFLFPILYAVYIYPRHGMIVAAVCALTYQSLGYLNAFPDTVALVSVTGQAVLFICIAALVGYIIDLIRAGEAQYRTVFEHSQLGIILLRREDLMITRCNRKFAEMIHYPPDTLAGSLLSQYFFTGADAAQFGQTIQATGEHEDFEARLSTKEGEVCWVTLSWSLADAKMVSCTAVNITARKIAEKAVNDNMAKYRQLTENSPTGIIIIQDRIVQYTNPAFTRFSGYPAEELTGREIWSLIDAGDRAAHASFPLTGDDLLSATYEGEFHLLTKSGDRHLGAVYSSGIRHFGNPAVLLNVIDLSDVQRLEEKIHLDNERRRGIIITVAHELRTPLQPIMGYLNLLTQDPEGFGLSEETRRILERCLSSVDREREIINQMLDLSVLESGKLQLSPVRFAPADLVQHVITAGEYQTKAEIALDISEGIEFFGDRDRLFTVINAILSNAVSYSRPPRKIRIEYRSTEGDPLHHLSFTDNGIGIPETALQSIFEPFQMADAAVLSRKYNRLGLSLSIARQIMRLHGGDITVESMVNVGSTFTIHLQKEAQP